MGLSLARVGLLEMAVFTPVPLLVAAAMWKWRKPLLGRLAGEPPAQEIKAPRPSRWGGCEVCDDRDARVVAPVWCASMLVVTNRWTGEFHRLCSRHALLRALPATVFSALAGGWGFPWGLIWTPLALYQNVVEGGAEDDADLYATRDARDPLHGRWESYVPPIALGLGLMGVPGVSIMLLSTLSR
ncbi:MAG TPA: hypothetical protein VE153_25810 [Myxococcus sp.]|nr:hypothetical protein [Myxococcus sp.]